MCLGFDDVANCEYVDDDFIEWLHNFGSSSSTSARDDESLVEVAACCCVVVEVDAIPSDVVVFDSDECVVDVVCFTVVLLSLLVD